MDSSSSQKPNALRVYVRNKLTEFSLNSSEIIPKNINGLATDVIPVGDIVALSRPTRCGVSVGHYRVTSGTLGCLVKRVFETSSETYILSNNHILANCNQAEIGEPILHPSLNDGGKVSNPIAELTEYEKLYEVGNGVNTMDAAIAKVLKCDEVLPEIIEIGALENLEPFTSLNELLGRDVCKYGRTTQYTTGTIMDYSVDFNMRYDNSMVAYFENQIGITWLEKPFSARGDSGSLIVDKATRRPVAQLFSAGKCQSFATPIDWILKRFQVKIV